MLDGSLDNGSELPVLLFLETNVTGVDAIFVERFCACRIFGEELVSDIVEVPDDRHIDAPLEKALLDVGHSGSRFVAVDRDANDLRTCPRQIRYLPRRGLHIRGIGIRHRLDDDRGASADANAANVHGYRPVALLWSGFGHLASFAHEFGVRNV